MALAKETIPTGVKQYKLTWVDPLDPVYLYSKMFDSQIDATYYIQELDRKFDYMMFEFVEYGVNGYKWELMPYGSYQSYKYGMIISEYLLAILLAIIVIYLILK